MTDYNPNIAQEDLTKIKELKEKIRDRRDFNGLRHLESLTEMARRAYCFEPVDDALEEIIKQERSCNTGSSTVSGLFQDAVLHRSRLLNEHTLAPETRVDSLISDLVELGSKKVSGEPPGVSTERAIETLKEVGHYRPEVRKEVAQAIRLLQV